MQPQARADGQGHSNNTNAFLSALFEGGLIGVRAVIAAIWRRLHGDRRAPRSQPREPLRDVTDRPRISAAAPTWDAVDEASWESFPASDPPTGWAGKDIEPPTLNGE